MKTSLLPRKSAMIIVAVVVALCISSVIAYAKNNAYTPDTTSIGIAEPIAEISAYTEAVEYQNEELSCINRNDLAICTEKIRHLAGTDCQCLIGASTEKLHLYYE